jgi:hypothetical protein
MKKINRILTLSFMFAVGLALTLSGTALADTLALWEYNGNASFSSSTAWATSSNNPVNSDSGVVGGVQNHVGSFRWGYNDGNQPAGGSGNYTVDPAGPESGGVLADDDRYRFELANNTTGLVWTVDTTGYTGIGISLGLYSSLDLTQASYTNSFKLGYTTDNGTNWTYTTFTYNGSSAWASPSLTGLPDGVDAFRLMLNVDPSGSEILTVDYVQVTGNAVPIPAAAWLLGSGLVGLVVIKRRKKK